MLLALITVLGAILLGYVGGGRLGRVGDVRLAWAWVLAIALLAQVALTVVVPGPPVARFLLGASLAAVLVFAWANRRLPGMWLALAGLVLNAAVMAANGAMPVAPEALSYLGGEEAIDPGKHRLLEEGDPLPWLADVIPIPGLRLIVSVGDILLAVGAGLLVVRVMTGAGQEQDPEPD